MVPDQMKCDHTCRNACAMLNQALREETSMVRFYEQILTQCDFPEIQQFVRELTEERSQSVIRILQKLNEMRARAEIMDGVNSSFDPAGC